MVLNAGRRIVVEINDPVTTVVDMGPKGLPGPVGPPGPPGTTDHGELTGLADDDHLQYPLMYSQPHTPETPVTGDRPVLWWDTDAVPAPLGELPPGGLVGQYLVKAGTSDFDARWVTNPDVDLPANLMKFRGSWAAEPIDYETINFESGVMPPGSSWTHEPTISVYADPGAGTSRAMRFAPIQDSQTTSVFIDFEWEPGYSEPWPVRYYCSTEDGYDFVRIFVDGVMVLEVSGQPGTWQQLNAVVDVGVHTAEFRYSKDSTVSTGQDTCWFSTIGNAVGGSGEIYYVNDVVIYEGSSYVLVQGTGAEEPGTGGQWRALGGAGGGGLPDPLVDDAVLVASVGYVDPLVQRPWASDGYNGLMDYCRLSGISLQTAMSTTYAAHNSSAYAIDGTSETESRTTDEGQAGAWWEVDFGANRRVVVSRYGLRCYEYSTSARLRNHRLEGSVDGQTWELLHDFVGTTSTIWTSVAVSNQEQWRFLRVVQTGTNTNSGYYIRIGEFEVWGSLWNETSEWVQKTAAVPAGGSTGQALVKYGDGDYEVEWTQPASALGDLGDVSITNVANGEVLTYSETTSSEWVGLPESVTYGSAYQTHLGNNLWDNSQVTWWNTGGDANNYCTADFGAGGVTASGVYLKSEGVASTWDLSGSDDDTNWTPVLTDVNAPLSGQFVPFDQPYNFRYWKLHDQPTAWTDPSMCSLYTPAVGGWTNAEPTGGTGGGTAGWSADGQWSVAYENDGSSMDGITALSGTWSSDGSVISQTSNTTSQSRAVIPAVEGLAGDCVVEAEVLLTSVNPGALGQGIGFIVGFPGTNTTGGFLTRLAFDPGAAVQSDYDGAAANLRTTYAWGAADEWHTLRIHSVGNVQHVYVDGVLVHSVVFQRSLSLSSIGLYTVYNSGASFRNIKVWQRTKNLSADTPASAGGAATVVSRAEPGAYDWAGSESSTSFAFKGVELDFQRDVYCVGLSLPYRNPDGGTFKGVIISGGGATIGSIVAETQEFTPTNVDAVLRWETMMFPEPVVLYGDQSYGLMVGRTDGSDTYVLPVPFPTGNPGSVYAGDPFFVSNTVGAPRVASAAPAPGQTLDRASVGTVAPIFPLYTVSEPLRVGEINKEPIRNTAGALGAGLTGNASVYKGTLFTSTRTMLVESFLLRGNFVASDVTGHLCLANGTTITEVVATATVSTGAVDGWVEVPLAAPYILASGQQYMVLGSTSVATIPSYFGAAVTDSEGTSYPITGVRTSTAPAPGVALEDAGAAALYSSGFKGTVLDYTTDGPPGPGIAPGGAANTTLVKNSTADYDTAWFGAPVIVLAIGDPVPPATPAGTVIIRV